MSYRRKFVRDITGQTGYQQRKAQFLNALGPKEWPFAQRAAHFWEKLGPQCVVNAVLFAGLAAAGVWWAYPLLWLLPLLTWQMVITRIRNIAEHAVVPDASDPLRNTRTTHANFLERLFIAPYYVNYHLEHHLLFYVPCYNLPRVHRILSESRYADRMEVQPNYAAVLRLATAEAQPRGPAGRTSSSSARRARAGKEVGGDQAAWRLLETGPGLAPSRHSAPRLDIPALVSVLRPHSNEGAPMTAAFTFPGQGSQAVGMGKALAEAFPAARAVFDEVDSALGEKLTDIIWDGPAETLQLTENAQPALMAVSIATLRVLETEAGFSVGRDAAFVAGHSLGEYSALAAAGSLSVSDTATPAAYPRPCDAEGGAGRRRRDGGTARARLRGRDGGRRRSRAGPGLPGRQRQWRRAGGGVRRQGRRRARARNRQDQGRQARDAAAGVRAVPLQADAARRRCDGGGAGQV